MKKAAQTVRDFGEALRRVGNAYKDAALDPGTGNYEVSLVLQPLEREESERLMARVIKNERITESVPFEKNEELRREKMCRISILVTNVSSASAALIQMLEVVRQALHEENLNPDALAASVLPTEEDEQTP